VVRPLYLGHEESYAESVLERHRFKKTPLRKEILLIFLQAQRPIHQSELFSSVSKRLKSVDRASIYRNLSRFKSSGVLHELESNIYVLCSHDCDRHVHFLLFCQKCHKYQEIHDHGEIDVLSTLGVFKFFGRGQSILLRGTCASCLGSTATR
jgi:Fe2+ or Zn2+ uptake regulation protein